MGQSHGKAKPAGDIIFLDIDGVLNTRSSRDDGDHLPVQECLDNLAHIIKHAHRPSIVLSSTWRLDSTLLSALKKVFDERGLEILDCTPDLEKGHTGDRVDEILLWLSKYSTAGKRAPAWVAIDDLDLLRMNPRLDAKNFMRTRDSSGLTADCAEEVVAKLRRARGSVRSVEGGDVGGGRSGRSGARAGSGGDSGGGSSRGSSGKGERPMHKGVREEAR